ncbi:MAG: sialate O-acetylesterase [Candidatus Cryptobacteroides sp.]
MKLKKILFTLLTAFLAIFSLNAEVRLPHIIGDNMVLQRETEVKLWGTAKPGHKVTVIPSWNNVPVTVKTAKDGKWIASVRTGAAGGPYSISFDDGEIIKVNNVLLGEVWFCSGQSNMEMPVKGFGNQPVEGNAEVILGARSETRIRMCTVKKVTSFVEKDDCETSWSEHTHRAVGNTSATAYFFAEYLNRILDVPVGVIVSCWGGSRIEAWMNRETMSTFPGYDLSYLDTKEKAPRWDSPALMYNAMVAPFVNYTIKGFLWYQGEANRGRAKEYAALQPAYVKMMRELWGLGELPFYYVQIAPYGYDNPDAVGSALLREAQMKNMADIPHSGMAVTLDIGDRDCIHPAKKREVGHRLAYMALERDYGYKFIDSYPPVFKSMEVVDGKAVVSFKVGKMGMCPRGHALTGFELAGEDRIFHLAEAVIKKGDQVEVSCKDVPNPVAVRYCFHNWTDQASIFNNYGIPASSFRTDDWEVDD